MAPVQDEDEVVTELNSENTESEQADDNEGEEAATDQEVCHYSESSVINLPCCSSYQRWW